MWIYSWHKRVKQYSSIYSKIWRSLSFTSYQPLSHSSLGVVPYTLELASLSPYSHLAAEPNPSYTTAPLSSVCVSWFWYMRKSHLCDAFWNESARIMEYCKQACRSKTKMRPWKSLNRKWAWLVLYVGSCRIKSISHRENDPMVGGQSPVTMLSCHRWNTACSATFTLSTVLC